ncbi:NnrU family protein [Roseomonas sp. GCM10028921]
MGRVHRGLRGLPSLPRPAGAASASPAPRGSGGERGYLALYSLVSLAILAWLVAAAGRAPYVGLWTMDGDAGPDDGGRGRGVILQRLVRPVAGVGEAGLAGAVGRGGGNDRRSAVRRGAVGQGIPRNGQNAGAAHGEDPAVHHHLRSRSKSADALRERRGALTSSDRASLSADNDGSVRAGCPGKERLLLRAQPSLTGQERAECAAARTEQEARMLDRGEAGMMVFEPSLLRMAPATACASTPATPAMIRGRSTWLPPVPPARASRACSGAGGLIFPPGQPHGAVLRHSMRAFWPALAEDGQARIVAAMHMPPRFSARPWCHTP